MSEESAEDLLSKPSQLTDENTSAIRCSKNDQYKVDICQCDLCAGGRETKASSEMPEVNDLHLRGRVQFEAIPFVCPVCGKESVLVAPYMTKTLDDGTCIAFCYDAYCRVEVQVKSPALTKYFEGLS